jgi:hypothetical protein
MEIYEKPGIPVGYDVEFFDEEDQSIAPVTLPGAQHAWQVAWARIGMVN